MLTNYLGIEYSKERVKCALLVYDGKKYEISSLQNFESDSLNSSLDALVNWKKEILGDQIVKAVVSISESLIFLKEFKVPNAKKQSVDEAVYWELSNVSPLPPSQAIYEWSEVAINKDELNVVGMAVKDSVIQNLMDKLELAGVEVTAIEPSSVSLSRVAGENFQKNTMLLLVGDKETDIVVMKSGMPVFSTTSDVTLKRDKEKWQLSQSVAEAIAKNTHELIDFWEEKNQAKIQQVLITGDLVDKYFGLAASINKFAEIPVVIAKQRIISGLKFADIPKALINRFYISIGAVSRFGGDVYSGINLIPKIKKQKVEYELLKTLKLSRMGVYISILRIYLLVLILVGVFFITLDFSYKTGITSLEYSIANHPAQQLKNEVKSVNDYLIKIHLLSTTQKDEGDYLKRISELTPKEIKLTKVGFEGDAERVWVIQGNGSREAILSYFDKLEKDLGAQKISMPYSNLDNDEVNKFEINLIW